MILTHPDDTELSRKEGLLEETALNQAIEYATEAHVAGYDPHDQLIEAIYAYVYFSTIPTSSKSGSFIKPGDRPA